MSKLSHDLNGHQRGRLNDAVYALLKSEKLSFNSEENGMSDDKEKEVDWKSPIKKEGDYNTTRREQPENKPRDKPRDVKW